MTANLKDLRERRGRIVTDMRALLDAAAAEGRDLTSEDQARYDALFAEQDRIGTQIIREERQQELDRRMAEEAIGADETRQERRTTAGTMSASVRVAPRSTARPLPGSSEAALACSPARSSARFRPAPTSMAATSLHPSSS